MVRVDDDQALVDGEASSEEQQASVEDHSVNSTEIRMPGGMV